MNNTNGTCMTECEELAHKNAWAASDYKDLEIENAKLQQENDELKKIALALCDAAENDANLNPAKYALKCCLLFAD